MFVIQIADIILMGRLHFHHAKNKIPDSYIIDTPNRTEKQREFECAALSIQPFVKPVLANR